jgi:hypothetical protein
MLESDAHSSNKQVRPLRLQRFAASALVAIILTALYWNKFFIYSVGGDDYSLIESSRTFDLYGWFFSGFSDYFYVYDGSSPYTNFIRPVVNFIFWVNNYIFTGRPGFYFLSTILFVALYCYSLLCLSGFRPLGILLISLFCLASSSIAQDSLSSPPFGFDILAAAFVFGAINASFRNKYYISICLLFLAVFTKEIGLAACIAFAIYATIRTRDARKRTQSTRPSIGVIGYLVPVVAYSIIRYVGVGIGGTYTTNNLDIYTLIIRVIYFPFKFPMGLAVEFSGYRGLILSGQLSDFIIRLAPLLTNFFVFIGSVWMVVRYVKAYQETGSKSQSRISNLDENNILILCVFSLTSLYLCLVGADGRFYPLPQGCLLILLVRGIDNGIISKRLFLMTMISLLVIYSFLFANHAKSALAFEPSKVDRVLGNVIEKAHRLRSKNILLVNAPDIYSSPRYVAKYYKFNGSLDFLYNSRGSCGAYPQYNLLTNPENSRYVYSIKPAIGGVSLLPSASCDPEIQFNGYMVKQGDDQRGKGDNIFIVSGNEFRFSVAESGSKKKLGYIGIARKYDAIFVANYETGEVKTLAPVDGAY